MTNAEKLHSQTLYQCSDPVLLGEQTRRLDRLYDFNHSRPTERAKRDALLRELLAEFGEGSYIEPPFHANWAGKHVHFGRHVYANFNLTVVDDTHVYVDDYTQFGPNVVLSVAGHPIDPTLREQGYQYNLPIRIGRNCWIGAGTLLLPGVTIGDNSVIGAGSVVTRDIPAGVVAVGNPCRVLRPIGERDRTFFFRDRPIDYHAL